MARRCRRAPPRECPFLSCGRCQINGREGGAKRTFASECREGRFGSEVGLGDYYLRPDVIRLIYFRTTGLEHFAAENGGKNAVRSPEDSSVMRASENAYLHIAPQFQRLIPPWRASPFRRGSQGSHWRRGWDSNPRYACTHNGFRDRPDRPLRHPSAGWLRACRSHGAVG